MAIRRLSNVRLVPTVVFLKYKCIYNYIRKKNLNSTCSDYYHCTK